MLKKVSCAKKDCTVALTNKCLLGKPISECDFYTEIISESISLSKADMPEADDLELEEETPEEESLEANRKFHTGWELGISDCNLISRSRYSHLIGVLGETDVGKTCFLTAIYLMILNKQLGDTYSFAGSLTLPAWEDRARHWRRWNKNAIPDKLSDRTVVSDTRNPGLLHLCVDKAGKQFDFLFTDLPGEWTQDVIDKKSECSKISFLERADAIIVLLEGPELAKSARLHSKIQKMDLLLRRLLLSVNISDSIPIIIVISKFDQMRGRSSRALSELNRISGTLKINPEVIHCATYSVKPDKVAMGTGISEVLDILTRDESNLSHHQFVSECHGTSRYIRIFSLPRPSGVM